MSDIQWYAERACAAQVKLTEARNCSIVVMQPSTGKILAIAQAPCSTRPPREPGARRTSRDERVRPGSTAKVITGGGDGHGGQTPMSASPCLKSIDFHGFSFHDAEYHPTERWTIAGIAHSSNVGMVQVAQHVSPQVQYQAPELRHRRAERARPARREQWHPLPDASWWGDERYTLAFGQGVAVTAVQMASVYATIANGGVRVPLDRGRHHQRQRRFVPAPGRQRTASSRPGPPTS